MPTPAKDLCIVLVHGIGHISAGAVIESAERGIRRTLGQEVDFVERRVLHESDPAHGRRDHVESLRLRWRDIDIELLEFNWADIAGKIRMRSPFRALVRLMETVREAPRLALRPDSAASTRWAIGLLGWLQWLLLGVAAATIVGSITEVLVTPRVLACHPDYLLQGTLHTGCDPREEVATHGRTINPFTDMVLTAGFERPLWRSGYYASASMSWIFQAAVVLTVVILFVATPLFAVALVRWLLRLGAPWRPTVVARTLLVGATLLTLVVFAAFFLHAGLTSTIAIAYVSALTGSYSWVDFLVSAVQLLVCAVLLWTLMGVANLIRDTIHYLAAAPDSRSGRDGALLREHLSRLLLDLAGRPSVPRLVLVSHSLGTVILLDLLLNHPDVRAAAGRACDVVTAGSPIRRLINRLLPHRLPYPMELSQRLRQSPGLRVDRWFNVYRVGDAVGQALTRTALPRELFHSRAEGLDSERNIRDHLLEPRFGWPYGHSNYWHDRRFVSYLANQVVGPLLVPGAAPEKE